MTPTTGKNAHPVHSSIASGAIKAGAGKTKGGGIQNAVYHGESGLNSRSRRLGKGTKVAYRSYAASVACRSPAPRPGSI